LIRELARYERLPDEAKATDEQLHAAFFGEHPTVFCELVETEEGDVAGFAVWFLNYSTWTGTNGIYLEDLFVRPPFRGRGYGRALLVRLAQECVDRGYERFQWSVLDWNTPSIDFYRSLGAGSPATPSPGSRRHHGPRWRVLRTGPRRSRPVRR